MFYNETQLIGLWIESATINITGSLFLTLLLIFIAIMMMFMMLRMPIEYSIILNTPLMLIMMAYSSEFIAVGGAFLMYMGLLLGKYFPIGNS